MMSNDRTFIPKGDQETFLEAVISHATDGIMVIDHEGIIRFVNPAAKAMFSSKIENLEGYDFGIPVIDESIEIQAPHGGHIHTLEMRVVEIDWLGEKAYLAMLRDITARKEALLALQKSEKKYRQLFDHSINGYALNEIVVGDDGDTIDFIFLDVNKAFEELLGITKEEVIGKSAIEVIPGLENTSLINSAIKVAQSGEPRRFEFYSDIYNKHLLVSAYSPAPGLVATIFNDVTERVEAEKELQVSEEKYRELFENAITGFALHEIIVDEHGEAIDYVFLEVNDAFVEQTGLSREVVIGKTVREVLPGIEDSNLIQIYGDVALHGKPQRFESYSKQLNKHFQISVYSPKKGQFATLFIDITDRVNAENKLKLSEKRFRTLYETMAQGVVYQNARGEIISANPAAEMILGLSLDQMQGKISIDPAWKVITLDGEPIPGDQQPANVALRTGKKVENEVFGVYHPQRSTYVWLSVSATPQYRSGEDEPYRVFTIFLDITERINFEKQLQERLKEMRCLSRVSSAIQKDPSLEAVCRVAADELVSAMEFPEFTVGVVELAGVCSAENGFPEDCVNVLEVPIQGHDERYGRVAVYYLEEKTYDLSEKKDLLYQIAERLALWYERQLAQEKLKESEKRFRNAFDDAPYPIMIHAVDGEIISINNAWTKTSGYGPEDLLNLSEWTRKALGEKGDEVNSNIEEGYESEVQLDEQEFTIKTKSGENRIWQFTSAPLGTLPDGRQMAITMARDVTDQTQAELEKERYYDRMMALREIDQVISSILDLDNVLDLITSELGKIVDFDSLAVMLLDRNNMLEIIACRGLEYPDQVIGLKFPSEPGYPNYEVVEKKIPAAFDNVSDVFPLFTQPPAAGTSTRITSWLGVPLVSQDEVIGMFTVDRWFEVKSFSDEDILIATQFANRAAIAISNAQLYEKTISQLKKLELLRKIDSTITSSVDLEEALMFILRQITEGLNVDAASVMLYDSETQKLGMEIAVGFRSEIRSDVKINLGQGYSGKVAMQRESLFIPEINHSGDGFKYPVNLSDEGIISYYGLPLIAKGKLKGVLQIFHRSKLDPDEDWFDFARTLSGQAAIAVDNLSLFGELGTANQELISAYDATIEGWAHALEIRDQETEGHSRRVVELTLEVARVFDFDKEALVHIRRGVLLHDIGKMGIPDRILHKPGPLDGDEWDVMHRHPDFAFQMLKDIVYLEPALDIPHYHHERWDGSGYPDGLRDEEIPLVARIFAVVDAWDALSSDRPYRDAWPREKTIAYLKEQAGKQFDPEVVSIFLEIVQGD